MSDARKRIEIWFEGLGGFLFRHRWPVLLVMAALVTFFAMQLPKMRVDTSTEGFLHPQDPTLVIYDQFRHQFGRDEFIILALEPPEVFDLGFLNKLKALHRELEEKVPHLDDIVSLYNARNTRGQGDTLIVEDLLETMPADEAEMAALKARVMSNPLYRNRVISADGKVTTIVLKTDAFSTAGAKAEVLEGFDDPGDRKQPAEFIPLTDQENTEAVDAVHRVIERYRSPDMPIRMAGSPVVTHRLKQAMLADSMLFIRLALLIIAVCLLVLFRRLSGVILPLVVVVASVISTVGIMTLCGVPLKLPTQILPGFLLAVGVGASVHVLAIFYQNLNGGHDRRGAIVDALGHSGLAIVLTSLTTAAGLGSFATAEVAPIADLGIFAGLGVLLSLVYTVVLLPALLAIIPVRPARSRSGQADPAQEGRMDRVLYAVADFSTSHARSILAVSLAVILVSLFGVFKVTFGHDPLTWLPQSWPVKPATAYIDQRMRGSLALEVLVDTGRENGLYDRELLVTLDRLRAELEQYRQDPLFVGMATSLADMLKEINQALNENRPEAYRIPADPRVIPQEFLLFENSGSDDLEDVVDTTFRLARFSIKGPWMDAVLYEPFLDHIEGRFRQALAGKAQVTMTGMMPILARTLSMSVRSMARGYVYAFVVITLMMILLIGSLRVGLLSMLPNLLPIFITIGLLGWMGRPMDLFTMLVGSIAIGLAVDDTVHFMHHFRRYYAESGDVSQAVHQTLHTAGRAMLVTSIVLSAGFFTYMFSSMNNLFMFGLLTGLTIILALLADFLLSPALMALVHRAPAPQPAVETTRS